MNVGDIIPVLLLALLFFLLGAGAAMIFFVVHWSRRRRVLESGLELRQFYDGSYRRTRRTARPQCWLAVRSRNLQAVQTALGLRNAKPCSWSEGLSGERMLFIAPPVNGWILVIGSGVPDPVEDVDACFRLLLELSRKLGHVQVFHADPVLHHHGWAQVEAGRVLRAYAWAGATIWNQGTKTQAETDLGVKCFAYGEDCPPTRWGMSDTLSANVEKVPLLAARWSLDPAQIQEQTLARSHGIAGKPSVRF